MISVAKKLRSFSVHSHGSMLFLYWVLCWLQIGSKNLGKLTVGMYPSVVLDLHGKMSVVWLISIKLPQTELRYAINVLVHTTWWEEQDGQVQHFSQDF